MALVLADRVQQTTVSTGTGTITLASAVSGFQSFSVVGNGNTTYYTIVDSNTGDWEVGLGTYTSSGTTLSRTTVLSSSNSGSLVNFGAGIKQVFVTYPASQYGNVVGASSSLNSGIAVFSGTGGRTLANGASSIAYFADPASTQGYLSGSGFIGASYSIDIAYADGPGNGLILKYGNGATNSVTLQPPASGGQTVFTLPAGYGTNGYVLTTNGSGTLSWTAKSGSSGMSPVTAAMIWG